MAHITMREAISQALWEEMERDPSVFILGEEVGVWGGSYAVTRGFYDHFGSERVRDTPISEAGIIGAAIGAALVGERPVAELMTINFAFAAMDHIVNEAAKLHYMFAGQFKLPLVIRTVGGGGRQLGATHSQTPDAVFAYFPGLKVVAPGTPEDAKGTAEVRHPVERPGNFHRARNDVSGSGRRAGRRLHDSRSENRKFSAPGKTLRSCPTRKGLRSPMKAADALAQEGSMPKLLTCGLYGRSIWSPVLKSFRKTNRAVVVEEGWKSYGVGSEIASRIYEEAFDYVDAPIKPGGPG